MTRKEDQKELLNIPCVICQEPSTGVIRTKETCEKCYSILQRDNIYRYNKGLDIPDSFFIFKSCYFSFSIEYRFLMASINPRIFFNGSPKPVIM